MNTALVFSILAFSVMQALRGGEPTLADQSDAADGVRRQEAQNHPLVRAILDAFPGARIEAVHDSSTDNYGLPAQAPLGEDEPDGFDLVPPDETPDEPADLWETL